MKEMSSTPLLYTVFEGHELLAQGRLEDVVLKVRKRIKADSSVSILIFNDATGKQMDFDLRGSEKEVLKRLRVFLAPEKSSEPAGPGRPKLGVVAREVSLLPRHWEWLSAQSGGASATLRRLVEEAKKSSGGKEHIKEAMERTHLFMTAIAGDLPNYEEALRALYAKDKKKFKECVAPWPRDLKSHVQLLSQGVFSP